jgi:type IV secretion system protein VirD4
MGQTVIVLDPYRESGLPDEYYSSWNPLDLVDENDPQAIENAAAIADALIIKTSDENAHFDEAARIFVKGLILFVASSKRQDIEGNLLTVYDLLANGARDQLRTEAQASGEPEAEKKHEPFDFLLYLMIRQGGFASSVVAGAANMIKGMGQRERGSVLATARRNLEFLERAAIKDTFRSSSFDLDSLKTDEKGVTIYLCLPPQRMHDTSRFLRLMITACLERMYGIKAEPATGKPVLFILDEFASLRHMSVIEHAAGYAAGFGIKLWLILQDITQLKRNYQEAWETFMGNAGVIQAFANSDTASLEYLSKKIGQAEISQQVKSETTQSSVSVSDPSDLQRATLLTSWRAFLSSMNMQTEGQSATNSVSYNQQIKLTPLIQPEELEQCFAREEKNQLVLIKGRSNRPMNIDRWEYFSGWRFLGLFEPDREVPWSDFTEAEREASRLKSDWDAHVSAVLSEAKNYVAELQRDLAELERRLG